MTISSEEMGALRRSFDASLDEYIGEWTASLRSKMGEPAPIQNSATSEVAAALIRAVADVLSEVDTGPDYQRLFFREANRDAWWVSADGDDDADVWLIRGALEAVGGVGEVRCEAEAFPPRGEDGWVELWSGRRPLTPPEPWGQVDNANPNHDEQGRFAEGPSEHLQAARERGAVIDAVAREAAPVQAPLIPGGFTPRPQQAPARPAPTEARPLPEGEPADVLRELHERAGRGETTHDQIEEYVGRLGNLSKRQVMGLHGGMGFAVPAKSKQNALKAIADKIGRRLGHAERGREIEGLS